MKKFLKSDILPELVWGLETIDPGDMNKSDVLAPDASDATSDDYILCLNEDGEFELVQWWWAVDRTIEYPYWLPHPESPAAMYPDKRLQEAMVGSERHEKMTQSGYPVVYIAVREGGVIYDFFELPSEK